jgi:UDP-N-acetylmuramate: L-alanyl-gamma-D-glutamyl-meso-diaminopimelate ligase
MNIYFLGIGGAGVSALASVLVSEGHTVTGSDEGVYPPVSTYLDRLGVQYATHFDAAHVPADVDLAIVGTTAKLNADNPELMELTRRGVPRFTFAEFLGRHTAARENIIVAGSFGKSTLTALLAFLLRAAGRDPGYFVGAVPLDLPTTGHWGASAEFVMEGDEYVVSLSDRRSKFMLYEPRHTLISSLIHDHVNMFPTIESYEAPFADLIARTPKDGKLVCARQFEALRRLARGREVVWYGMEPGPGYHAADVRIGEITRFDLITPTGHAIPLATQMLGLHNVENIVGAAALLLELGLITPEQLHRSTPKFRGVARRLDKKTQSSRVPAYEGFGSSLEKARSAIDAIALHFPNRRQVVVFEPHTFSWRNADALAWYDTVFKGVAEVLMLPPPTHGAAAHAQLSHEQIVARVRAAGVKCEAVSGADETFSHLAQRLRGDEVVLLLSSGPLAGLADTLPPWLEKKFPDGPALG